MRKKHSKLAIANTKAKRENFAPANLAKWIALGIKVLREDTITDGYQTNVTDVAKKEHRALMERNRSEAGNRRRNRKAA